LASRDVRPRYEDENLEILKAADLVLSAGDPIFSFRGS
jgi:hypothetical protein